MTKKIMSLALAIVMLMGLSQAVLPAAEAADGDGLEITFSNLRADWDAEWGVYEFVFAFQFVSSENIYEVGMELRESDGFLKYTSNKQYSCQPFRPEDVRLVLGSHVIEAFVPGETYHWIAYVVCDGQRFESAPSHFTFSEKPDDPGSWEDNGPPWTDPDGGATETDGGPTLTISSHPSDVTVEQGQAATLRVYAASSNGSVSYQWYRNERRSTSGGTAIRGATSASYSPDTGELGTAYYYCVVTNAGEGGVLSETSGVARVAVEPVELKRVKTSYRDGGSTKSISTYPLDWFLTDASKSSTTYDPELAELAMALSCAAYDEQYIRSSLQEHGFAAADIKTVYGYENALEYENPPHALAKKTTADGKTVVAIVIKGTELLNLADWLNDFSTGYGAIIPGVGNTHARFEVGMLAVYQRLVQFMAGTSVNDGSVRYLITGHSKGAAIGNLLAKKLSDMRVAKSQVFAYTFATPNVVKAPGGGHNNIFNVCNHNDPVAYVPLKTPLFAWGKYGETYWFDTYETLSFTAGNHSGGRYMAYLGYHAFPNLGTGNVSADLRGLLASIFCPVDIEVVDQSGLVVARIVDNQVTDCTAEYGDLLFQVEGDEKMIFLREGLGYTLRLSATDNGTMDFSVQDYDLVSQTSTVTKAFEDVPLTAGKHMAVRVGGEVEPHSVRLYVTDAGGEIVDEVIGRVVSDFPFDDVSPSDWFYSDVKTAYEFGLINGTSDTAFSPNSNLTYAEAVKLAACMHQTHREGAVTLENGSPWYQPYVEYANANQIIGQAYDWNAPATRAGYMEIFARALPDSALAAINAVGDGAIPDVPSTHPSAAAIYRLYRAGILQGVDAAHNCSPDSTIRRSEVAAILTRMMDSSTRIRYQLLSAAGAVRVPLVGVALSRAHIAAALGVENPASQYDSAAFLARTCQASN
ncbi:MAG: hypothetical protein GXX99_03010 [Clostridiales bacterium]|nr:hypothetical protein [Clostridiales bacterium]